MPDLEALFRRTFDDQVFTRAERQALAKILQESPLDEQERGVLRAKVFDMAGAELSSDADRRVLGWLHEASKVLGRGSQAPTAGADRCEVYFSPQGGCPDAICDFIRAARRQLDICVFTISDDRITEEIIAAHRRVAVRILTDNEKLFDKGSDIDRLAGVGLDIRVDRTENHMHHKFALADDGLTLTGSYNWTRSANLYNEENILISDDPRIFQAYRQEFDQLWAKMSPYR
ncbi:MAG: phospholipase D-like domain-containing protein [Bacteroidia bacterium]